MHDTYRALAQWSAPFCSTLESRHVDFDGGTGTENCGIEHGSIESEVLPSFTYMQHLCSLTIQLNTSNGRCIVNVLPLPPNLLRLKLPLFQAQMVCTAGATLLSTLHKPQDLHFTADEYLEEVE